MRDASGNPVQGYGWIFPAGDGTVNIGVGALSTMKRFKRLNLNSLLGLYHAQVRKSWGVGFLFGATQGLAPANEFRPASRSRMGGGGGRGRADQPHER